MLYKPNWLDRFMRKYFPVAYIRRYLKKNPQRITKREDDDGYYTYMININELQEMTVEQFDKAIEKGWK